MWQKLPPNEKRKYVDLTKETRTVITSDGVLLKGTAILSCVTPGLVVVKKENDQWLEVISINQQIPPQQYYQNIALYSGDFVFTSLLE